MCYVWSCNVLCVELHYPSSGGGCVCVCTCMQTTCTWFSWSTHACILFLWAQVSRQYLVPMSWCSADSSGTSSVPAGGAGKGGPLGVVSERGEEGHNEKGGTGVKELLKQIADVSEMATRRSGLTFDAQSGMYYDAQSGLYYDQVGLAVGCWQHKQRVYVCVCTEGVPIPDGN